MSDPYSRYRYTEIAEIILADGRTATYLRRRFLPRGETLPVLARVTVAEGDRLDLIAARTIGHPLAAWRIGDANDAMDPQDLDTPGARLIVPVPQP